MVFAPLSLLQKNIEISEYLINRMIPLFLLDNNPFYQDYKIFFRRSSGAYKNEYRKYLYLNLSHF